MTKIHNRMKKSLEDVYKQNINKENASLYIIFCEQKKMLKALVITLDNLDLNKEKFIDNLICNFKREDGVVGFGKIEKRGKYASFSSVLLDGEYCIKFLDKNIKIPGRKKMNTKTCDTFDGLLKKSLYRYLTNNIEIKS